MKSPTEIIEPSFGLEDIPDEPVGYGKPPKKNRFGKGQNRNSGVASVARRNALALWRMIYWGCAQEQPNGRTALQIIVEKLVSAAMDGCLISQRLLFDLLAPPSAKLLLANELADSGENETVVIIRDMTKRNLRDPKTEAASAAFRVVEATALGAKEDEGTKAMLTATASVDPKAIFDFADLDEEFEKATKDQSPIEEWDDESRAEMAKLLKLNPDTVPDPNGPDPADRRYNPGPDRAETIVKKFFADLGAKEK